MPARAALFLILLATLLTGCSSGPRRWEYREVPGKTAALSDGQAFAPERAPAAVHAAIAAANRIAGSSYAYGGGHGESGEPQCFDCSGAASYVLRAAGLMRGSMPSQGFRRFDRSGEGEWISVWARNGHVFLVVAGLRFDTGWHEGAEGPRWTKKGRPTRGYVIRHPAGL